MCILRSRSGKLICYEYFRSTWYIYCECKSRIAIVNSASGSNSMHCMRLASGTKCGGWPLIQGP